MPSCNANFLMTCAHNFIIVALKHICIELELTSKKKRRLIEDEYGVHTLNDLLRLESRLENGELGSMVEVIKEKLLVAAAWRRKYPEVVVSEHFCSDVWDEYVESCEGNEVSMDADLKGNDVSVDAEVDGSKDHTDLHTNDGVSMDVEMKVSLLIPLELNSFHAKF